MIALGVGLRGALALIMALVTGTATPGAPRNKGLLPPGVTAERYDLTLAPDADHLTLQGRLEATLRTVGQPRSLVMNAVDLRFTEASLDNRPIDVSLDPGAQTATFTPRGPLVDGPHVLRVAYSAPILQRPSGLFAVDARDPDGRPDRTLVTQLEPADARRLAPLLDEPADKAVFALTVVAPLGPTVVSNMPVAADRPAGPGLHRVSFVATPPMSPYLLFLAIGRFDRTSRIVDGVDVGVLTPKGLGERGRFALDTATAVLRDYDAYFGVRFPLPKLDLVVAPGEVGAAMENWGAMLFGASSVLIDPEMSTESDRRAAALLVAHEMAHQWFGDLVTMRWWDDLWLNEAFASWRSTKALENLHPAWRPWLAAMGETEEAMTDDALPTSHAIERPIASPAQAAQAFDSTTYEKGQAVVRMAEAYVGADVFREAVRRYVRRYAFRNTEGADLWREIAEVSHKDVADIARDFTAQPGVPLVTVGFTPPQSPTAVQLVESRFTEVGDLAGGHWRIPLKTRGLSKVSILLDGATAAALAPGRGPVLVNSGALAYARILYSPQAFATLATQFPSLPAADQIAALNDAWALGLAGRRPLSDTFELIDRLSLRSDPATWRRAGALMAQADDLHDDGEARRALHAWARRKLAPLHARLGWEHAATDGPDDGALRSLTLLALARFDDPEVLSAARRRFDRYVSTRVTTSPETLRTFLRIVSRHADAAAYEALLLLARGTNDPMRREALYALLGRATNPALARRTLELAVSDEIPPDTGPSMVSTVAEQHPELAWTFALAHRAALMAQLDSVGAFEFLPDIAADSFDPARADALLADAAANLAPADREPAQRAAALIRLNVRVRSDRLLALDKWIASHG